MAPLHVSSNGAVLIGGSSTILTGGGILMQLSDFVVPLLLVAALFWLAVAAAVWTILNINNNNPVDIKTKFVTFLNHPKKVINQMQGIKE